MGDSLLSDSHMRHHPVTPMTEPNLVRHLQAQTSRKVGLIGHSEVRAGPSGVRRGIERCREQQVGIALVDAVSEDDLHSIAEAVVDLPLITGGSGMGMTLPAVWAHRGLLDSSAFAADDQWPAASSVLILSGSCSAATLEQLAFLQEFGGAGLRLDVDELLSGEAADVVERLFRALRTRVATSAWALVYSSASPEDRTATLAKAAARGVDAAEISRRIEWVTGELARRAVAAGLVDSVVVAGGETTGAVTQALEVTGVEIGSALDPGVPMARSIGPKPVNLVFKSGNFGTPDFFVKTLRKLGLSGMELGTSGVRAASSGAS